MKLLVSGGRRTRMLRIVAEVRTTWGAGEGHGTPVAMLIANRLSKKFHMISSTLPKASLAAPSSVATRSSASEAAAPLASSHYAITICSKNPAKTQAVEAALKTTFPQYSFALHPVSSDSGVPDQPVGNEETLRGALNRVRSASEVIPPASSALIVAIEGGVEWLEDELHCFAWVVVESSSTGAISKARSASFMLPRALSELVKQGMELGEADDKVFQRTNSGQGSGTVGQLSGGLITRSLYYKHAAVLALLPFLNPDLYPDHKM
eukprot:gene29282-12525_t